MFSKNKIRTMLVLLAMVFIASSCTKENTTEFGKEIKTSASEFSRQHDRYLKEMLEYQAKAFPQKTELTMSDVLDVIENVIGVRPVVLEDTTQLSSTCVVMNLDADTINLADYSTSSKIESYLSSVDQILLNLDENDSLTSVYQLLDGIESSVMADNQTTDDEKETVVNAVEVLKGSLVLWNNYLDDDAAKVNPQNWPRWKKVLFISAADAIGAVLGYFVGTYIRVMGVYISIPPGLVGAAAGAAAVSYLASVYVHMVH